MDSNILIQQKGKTKKLFLNRCSNFDRKHLPMVKYIALIYKGRRLNIISLVVFYKWLEEVSDNVPKVRNHLLLLIYG